MRRSVTEHSIESKPTSKHPRPATLHMKTGSGPSCQVEARAGQLASGTTSGSCEQRSVPVRVPR